MQRLLGPAGIAVEPLPDEVELPPEDGVTFADNAMLKAAAAATATGRPAIADDSGIEATALGGAPGVRSARFAGQDATDEQNLEKLVSEAPADSRLRYVCALAYVNPETGEERVFFGDCRGRLAARARRHERIRLRPRVRSRRHRGQPDDGGAHRRREGRDQPSRPRGAGAHEVAPDLSAGAGWRGVSGAARVAGAGRCRWRRASRCGVRAGRRRGRCGRGDPGATVRVRRGRACCSGAKRGSAGSGTVGRRFATGAGAVPSRGHGASPETDRMCPDACPRPATRMHHTATARPRPSLDVLGTTIVRDSARPVDPGRIVAFCSMFRAAVGGSRGRLGRSAVAGCRRAAEPGPTPATGAVPPKSGASERARGASRRPRDS